MKRAGLLAVTLLGGAGQFTLSAYAAPALKLATQSSAAVVVAVIAWRGSFNIVTLAIALATAVVVFVAARLATDLATGRDRRDRPPAWRDVKVLSLGAQVVAVGGRMHSLEDMTKFVEIFLAEPFSDEERHVRRIDQLHAYDADGVRPALPDSAKGLGPAEDQD